jgi:hypothetical protein
LTAFLTFLQSKNVTSKNGRDAVFQQRKGLKRKYRSTKGRALCVRNWSGKPGFRPADGGGPEMRPQQGEAYSYAFIPRRTHTPAPAGLTAASRPCYGSQAYA